MSENGFDTERTLGFEYVRKWKRWFLVGRSVDPEIKRIIGSKALRMPFIIKLPSTPPSFLLALYRALAEHGLEAGRIGAFCELPNEDPRMTARYRVEITVRRRCSRPSD
jgi:hypothetical protein